MQSTTSGEVKQAPRISVVLPTCNSETYLEEAIDSLLAQTFEDFELLVVDDNSNDRTLALLADYQKKDPRISVIPGPGNGLAAALNFGVRKARGEFIARMDADDIARDNRFQKQVEMLDANPEVGACGTLFQQFIDGNDLHVHMEKVRLSDLLYGCYIGHPTVMFRRQLFIDHELFYNEALRYSEDYELWSRAIRFTKLGNVPENLLWYRRHSKSASVMHKADISSVDVAIKLDMIDYVTGGLPEKIRVPLKALLENRPVEEAEREALVGEVMDMIRFPEQCSRFELLSYFHQLKEFSDDFLRRIAADTLSNLHYYVISYNHLTHLKSIVKFFQSIGAKNVSIIDNASTFQPLKEYLKTCPYRVYYMHKNYGHMVLFECPVFRETIDNEFFVLTDPDILPVAECPSDYLLKFLEILLRYPMKNKVGFSLKIDDLPDHYKLKENVIQWEKGFFKNGVERRGMTIYDANLDTTFALYRPRREWRTNHFYEAYRVGAPYTARHLPWYRNLAQLSDEEIFYIQNDLGSSNWNGTMTTEELHKKYGTTASSEAESAEIVIRLKHALTWPFRKLRNRIRRYLQIAKSISHQI